MAYGIVSSNGLISTVKNFLKDEWPMILIVVVVFMTLLSIFLILGINFNPPTNKKIQKEVVVESMARESMAYRYRVDGSRVDGSRVDGL